jgi:hypothetical protein
VLARRKFGGREKIGIILLRHLIGWFMRERGSDDVELGTGFGSWTRFYTVPAAEKLRV